MAVPQEDHAREAWQALTDLFLGDQLHDRLHEVCDAVGLPHPGALKALRLIDEHEPPAMRALAERMPCDPSYMTQLVDVLENLGYVERVAAPVDRRVKLVRLTPQGVAAREKAREILATPPDLLRDALTEAEAKTLARLMAKIVQNRPTRSGP